MFHFPTFPPNALCVQAPVAGHDSSWVSPFGNPRITARLPAPRGLSQAPTSFIGSWCQGIHHVPLVACHYKRLFDARVHYAVLKKRAVPAPCPPRGRMCGSFGAEMVRETQLAGCLIPQDPTTCQAPTHQALRVSTPAGPEVLTRGLCGRVPNSRRSTSEHLASRRSLDIRVSGCRRNRHRTCSLERR